MRAIRVAVICLTQFVLLPAGGHAQARADGTARPFTVTHYDVVVEPDLQSRSITGTVILSVATTKDVTAVVLDRGSLEIDEVREDRVPRSFVTDGSHVRVTLPAASAGQRTLTIRYHGTPKFGLVFVPEREQVYTVFSTTQWMIALDGPDARATLRLRVTMPRDWNGAGSGRHVSRTSGGATWSRVVRGPSSG